jgi:HSP20 family protein
MEGNSMVKKSSDKSRSSEEGRGGGIGGILKGLADLVETLGELTETGQEISRTGEIHGPDSGKNVRGIYGFNVKFGLEGDKVRVEPFGNIRRDKKTGQSAVQEIREPVVDVFEEEDYTLVIAEMPGISAQDVRLDVKDDLLTISAEKGDKKYSKEVLLPRNYSKEKMLIACNNGILEIKCSM